MSLSRWSSAKGSGSLDERERPTPEEEALAEMLTLIIEDYGTEYHQLPAVSPNESLKALMDERGLAHEDIWPILDNKGGATEVLAGHRGSAVSTTQLTMRPVIAANRFRSSTFRSVTLVYSGTL